MKAISNPLFAAIVLAAVSIPSAGTASSLPGTEVAAPSPHFDLFDTPNGKTVAVACLKHATLLIRYDGLEIHVDPVGEGIPPSTDYSAFPKADLILVTHEHFDHFDPAAIATLSKDGTAIYANQAVCGQLGRGTPLANGERVEWHDGISIEAIPACNTSPDRLRFHPRGRDNGYVLDLGGFRIYVAGDTEPTPEMASLRDIDLAFLPCNLPYTMTPEQTAAAALSFRPKTLVPYHYGDTPIRRIADLLAGSGIDVRISSR